MTKQDCCIHSGCRGGHYHVAEPICLCDIQEDYARCEGCGDITTIKYSNLAICRPCMEAYDRSW
jgi:hypothetical protein